MEEQPRRGHYKRPRYQQGVDAKIVVMGNTGVGKTSLLHRYTQNKFDPKNTTSTTGAFFVSKKVDVNGLKVRLQLWDTAGQERFRSMAPMYYRGANAALLLYDITNESSFRDIRGWLEELKRNCSPDLIIYIVGAKADLHHRRQVTSDLARLSLHNWFPPPKPPSPPPPPQASAFSYIRPRFTSFTSVRSLPSSPTSAQPSSPDRPSHADPPIQWPQGLSSPSSSSSSPVLKRSSTTAVPRIRTTTLPLGRANSTTAAMSPSRFGVAFGRQAAAWNELVDESSNSLSEEDEDGDFAAEEWGLGKGMELFEASAKDGAGIQQLFESLIAAIIQRKDIIEAENEMKKRDSVMLSTSTPSWAAQADEEDETEKARKAGGWICCST